MAALNPPLCQFGWPAPDFALPDTEGRVFRLADVRGPKGLLVMFICNHCPYVKGAIERIVRDVAELQRDHGIGAVAIMPNDTAAYPEDDLPGMRRFAAEHGFTFPYLIDQTQATARAWDAVCTPDFFGFNHQLELQYRGRLDAGRIEAVPGARRELFEALATIAATGHGPAEQWPSLGCSIKWRAAA